MARKRDNVKQKEAQEATSVKGTTRAKAASESAASLSGSGEHFPIVALGSSAGGLEALDQFFSSLESPNGMAFVVVAHFASGHASLLPELIAKHTWMPVATAVGGTTVEPDCVYVIPPGSDMTISGGVLHLDEQIVGHGPKHPIDLFFRSLARDQGANAVCIVLSGTGTDGTLGLRDIKAEFGTTIVQDPLSAKYDGMPSSALATGLADYVLTPSEMSALLTREFGRSTSKGAPRLRHGAVSESDLRQILALVRAQTGHDFTGYKTGTISRRVARRMALNRLANIQDYLAFAEANLMEIEALVRDSLIGVTGFFRDPQAFDALKEKVMARIEQSPPGTPIRAWIPGSGTGEEAYSVAIVTAECLRELKRASPVQVFATDINEEATAMGRAGIYPSGIASDVGEKRLSRYFSGDGDSYRIGREIREMVVFATHDILRDPPFSKMDLICCRNLLIYLGAAVQKRVLANLHYSLNANGILFLGPAEALGELSPYFSTLDAKWRVFERKGASIVDRGLLELAFQPAGRRRPRGAAEPAAEAPQIAVSELARSLL